MSAYVAKQGELPVNSMSQLLHSRVFNLAIGTFLSAVWVYFAYRHLVAFEQYGLWSHLAYGCFETIMAAFFVFRSTPQTVSPYPLDWCLAFLGTFAPALLTPETSGVLTDASYILYIGIVLQFLGVLSLNRSFALVAAKRELKTKCMYRFVRHPLYAGHIVAMSGYVLTNTSTSNLWVFAITLTFLLLRIVREEKHLALDPLYQQYMARVRYRLVPFVF